jgi:hypothetical protein
MIQRAGGVEDDDRGDEDAAGKMPDEDAVRQRLILSHDGGKGEQSEHVDRVAVGVGSGPAEQGDDEQEEIERVLAASEARRSNGDRIGSGGGTPNARRRASRATITIKTRAPSASWKLYKLSLSGPSGTSRFITGPVHSSVTTATATNQCMSFAEAG